MGMVALVRLLLFFYLFLYGYIDCVECGQKAITFKSHQMDGKIHDETETETRDTQREQHELELDLERLCQQYRNFD